MSYVCIIEQENIMAIQATEEFIECWQAAGSWLQRQAQGQDLAWMRANLDLPLMEHLSFRLGNQLFFIRVTDADDLIESPGTQEDLMKIAAACNGHACLMPMRFNFGTWMPANKGWGLISAKDGSAINPPDLVTDEKIELSDWELHDFAVQAARMHLTKEGEQVLAANSKPELQPSIWLGGEQGSQWVVVQAVRWPEEAKIPANIKEIEARYKDKNTRGNFAYVLFANEKQDINTPLKEGEKPLPIYRGDKVYISWSGLCDINE